jgi:valyl-tRNA synthetase
LKPTKRIDKQLEKLDQEIARIEGKLSNEGFVAKAPAAVIDKERAKMTDLTRDIEKLNEQKVELAKIEA